MICIWQTQMLAVAQPKISMSKQITLGTIRSRPRYCRLLSSQMLSRVSPKSSSCYIEKSSSNLLITVLIIVS